MDPNLPAIVFDWQRPAYQRIDYVFVNEPVEVLKYAVLTDSKDRHYPSDHFPVIAKVRF
jgi:Endonuclease/Exonuclease/phosphatase family.